MKRRTLITAAACMAAAASTARAQDRADANGWRIARSLPLTGPQSSYGEAKRDGGDAFAAIANAHGGVAGKRLVLTTEDDGYDDKRTAQNVQQLAASHSPIAFAGFFGAPQCVAAANALGPLGIAGVGFTTGSNAFREKPQREIFPVRSSFAQETAAIVRHHRTTGVRQAVIAYVDIPFGRLARASFEQAARDSLTLAPPVELLADGTNVKQAAAALRASGLPVLMALHTPSAIALAAELRRANSQQSLWCLSAVDTVVLQGKLGPAARGLASSIVVPPTNKLGTPVVREYLAATQAIGKPATVYGLEAFIEMKTLALGLARTRGGAPRDLIAALESLGRADVGGFEVSYGPGDRTGARFVDLVMVSSAAVVA
jgi:ABC-type branched-subunit amino acid transport system substrate-binding protein